MIVINLYGGPGVGKSTMAAELFVKMKKQGYKVELVTEFAKDLVYADETTKLSDQLIVFAKQHHKIFRLKDKVDYIISDSPLIISKIYNESIHPDMFNPLVDEIFNSYNNMNYFIKRNKDFFQEYGRVHDLNQSLEIDNIILGMLEEMSDEENITFKQIEPNDINEILEDIKE